MINQDDLSSLTSLDAVAFPSELQNIGSEEGNEEFINIVQLTNNNYRESDWQISDNKVVWTGYDGGDREIFLYDGSTTLQLTNNNYNDDKAQISGNNIVWIGSPDGNDDEIYFYDGTNTIQLTNNNEDDYEPQISSNKVVWTGYDGNDREIYLYDGFNTIQLTNNNEDDRSPQISGNNVVWAGGLPYSSIDEIFLYDGSNTIQLTNNIALDYSPKISGNNVVWNLSYKLLSGIYLYDGTNTIQLTNNNFSDGQISGNNVVWSGYESGDNVDAFDYESNEEEVFLYDGTTTHQITDNNYHDYAPQISANNVVWTGSPDGQDDEVFLYDGSTPIQLTNNDYDEWSPQISGNNVVWSGNPSDNEIFLATLPSNISESTPIVLSPSISINDVSLGEGNDGNTDVTFTISVAQAGNETITVDYATSDNTAFAGKDYIATNGTLEFDPGTTEKTITIEVIGDIEVEETETFTVNLSNATNAVIVDSQGQAVLENDDILPVELYRFRYETGGYLFVGEQEKDAILANPNYNQAFTLEGVAEDGTVNSAFIASDTSGVDLVPFYRLRSLDTPGNYLFVSTGEYNSIFAESSHYKDRWAKEGLDLEGFDIPDFYLYGAGANQGIEFHRLQNINNHSYLFAGLGEIEVIYNDPLLSANFVDEGSAFKSLI